MGGQHKRVLQKSNHNHSFRRFFKRNSFFSHTKISLLRFVVCTLFLLLWQAAHSTCRSYTHRLVLIDCNNNEGENEQYMHFRLITIETQIVPIVARITICTNAWVLPRSIIRNGKFELRRFECRMPMEDFS